MCSSYFAFDCISRNRLIVSLLLVCGPLAREMSQDRYISLGTFQSIFLSLCRCCCCSHFSKRRDVLNFRVKAVRDIEPRTRLSKNIYLSRDFLHIQKLKYQGKCSCKCLFVQYRYLVSQIAKVSSRCTADVHQHRGSILGFVNLFKIFRGKSEDILLWGKRTDLNITIKNFLL